MFLIANRTENAELVSQYHPVDLAEGYADYAVPKHVTDALATTAVGSNPLLNQYARGFVSTIAYQ